MKQLNIVLPDSTYNKISNLARKTNVDPAQYCSAMLTELAEEQPSQVPPPKKPRGLSNGEQVTQVDLMREILAYLKQRGGAAPKINVEHAIFEKFQNVFKSPHYLELVGGKKTPEHGIPRWKKNVQFARNTARDMGLVKTPEESGRGNWELTIKGRDWKFE